MPTPRFAPGLALAGLIATIAAAPDRAMAADRAVVLHAATGSELTTYSVDTRSATLTRGGSVTLPENVQEAWPHPSGRYLYAGWSSNSGGPAGHHGVSAFRVDPASGALSPHGQPIALKWRPVFLTVDAEGKYLLVAYNLPSGVSVHRIEPGGTLGEERAQPAGLDFGIYAHQVGVDPSGRMVLLPTRGNVAAKENSEDPGALKVFAIRDGVLANRATVAPDGGHHFQPRHAEFHPSRPFVFVTIEAQNLLHVYRLTDGPSLSAAPLFSKTALADPSRSAGQATSAIHAHPNGKFVYLGNRGPAGGENSIAVFAVNPGTGEPTLIQSASTHGVHPRTFALDPSGRILVVANMQRAGDSPASLAVFRTGDDGKLTFVRKYEQQGSDKRGLFWTGMMALPR